MRETTSSATRIRALCDGHADGHARAKRLFESDGGVLDAGVVLEELRVHNAELVAAEEELCAQLDALGEATAHAQRERARYRSLFEHAPDAFFVTDELGVVRDANSAAGRLLDIAPAFLRGKPLAVFVHAEDVPRFREVLASLEHAPAADFTVRLRARDGHTASGVFRGAHPHGDGRVLWTVRTDNVRAERDEPRDAALKQARSENRELEAKNRAKDRFLAMISHDLRSPMSAILGWTELLRDGALEGERRDRALEIIDRNARAQLGLVEQLLDVTRIGSGKLSLEFTSVELRGLVRDVLEAALPTAQASGIVLSARLGDGDVVIQGDRQRLDQVVRNLLSNAVKFTPRDGKVWVTLEVREGYAEIRVTDTGKGIPGDVLPHVFDWLEQAEASKATTGGGLGLGLFIVRQIVERHGGYVSATSGGTGEGAELTVSLPMRFDSSAPPPVPSAAPSSRGVLSGCRVVVVEDDDAGADSAALLLAAQGALVETARDAIDALARVATHAPDVLVSDLGLPGTDGGTLLGLLRARPGRSFGAVALGGFASDTVARSARTAGFDAFVPRPIDQTTLVTTVRRLWRRPRP